jgi:phage major head subunit gpT-like protein
MIVNKAALVGIEKSFKKIFTDALHGSVDQAQWPKFATKFTTSAGEVDYGWMAAIPGMAELKGSADITGVELVNWVLRNKEYARTLALKEADIERDQLGVYSERLRLLADAGARHPDELLAALMLAGFATKDYTGKNFFDTSKKHSTGGKASFDNKLTDELATSSFEEARQMLRTMKVVHSDNTETQLNLGRDMVLVVSPANESVARQILQAERDSAGATNVNRGTARLEVWGYLGDSANWFLLDAGYPVKPFAFQEEKPVSIAGCTDPEDSYVLLNHEYLYQAYGRYTVGYFLPQLCIGSTGADAVA